MKTGATKWMLTVLLTAGVAACANQNAGGADRDDDSDRDEVKVKLADTPEPVRRAIEAELAGGTLEDIARKQSNGRTVYETDIIRIGHEWEIIVAEDGQVISRRQEDDDEVADEKSPAAARDDGWRDTFSINKADLGPDGDNVYFSLRPGTVLSFRDGDELLTIAVLDQTRVVDGVTTRIVEEREEEDGQLKEISRNFFAADRNTGDVYYFGEEVDIYKNGKISSHEGAWLSGEHNARFGLLIAARPAVGDKHYQEIAPGQAMDRAEVISLTESLTTPAGTFRNVVHVKETSPLERGASHKWYVAGVGLIKDDKIVLVSHAAAD